MQAEDLITIQRQVYSAMETGNRTEAATILREVQEKHPVFVARVRADLAVTYGTSL